MGSRGIDNRQEGVQADGGGPGKLTVGDTTLTPSYLGGKEGCKCGDKGLVLRPWARGQGAVVKLAGKGFGRCHVGWLVMSRVRSELGCLGLFSR